MKTLGIRRRALGPAAMNVRPAGHREDGMKACAAGGVGMGTLRDGWRSGGGDTKRWLEKRGSGMVKNGTGGQAEPFGYRGLHPTAVGSH